MKFNIAVSALLMASAYGFAPTSVNVRQVSTLYDQCFFVEAIWLLLPCNISLTKTYLFPVNSPLEH
jgi:hypothetical protein